MTIRRTIFTTWFSQLIKRSAVLSVTALALSGCVGLAVGTYGKHERPRENFNVTEQRNQFGFKQESALYTAETLFELWGEPDHTESYQECHVLLYNKGRSWAGVGAFVVVVPLPLLVPTGTYKNRFYARDGKIIGLVQEYGEVKRALGYSCGSNDCKFHTGGLANPPAQDASDAQARWCSANI